MFIKQSFFTLLLLGVILNSCKDEYNICNQSRNVLMQAVFYTYDSGVQLPYTPPNLSLRVLSNSLFIHNHVSGLPAFSIPLSPALDSTRFYIQHAAGAPADTLTLVYNTFNIELSPACGTVNYNTLIRAYATQHSIDSVALKNASVTNALVENIQIYY